MMRKLVFHGLLLSIYRNLRVSKTAIHSQVSDQSSKQSIQWTDAGRMPLLWMKIVL
jgi:hypothetical protein